MATSIADGPVLVVASADQLARGCLDDVSKRATDRGPVAVLSVEAPDDAAAALSSAPSVVVVGDEGTARLLTSVAANAGIDPTWVAADGSVIRDEVARGLGQSWHTAVGLTIYEPPSPLTADIGYAVYKSEARDEPVIVVDTLYRRLSLLGIGIQLAGRDLTPATFEAGLRRYPPKIGPYGTWDLTTGYTTVADVAKITWQANAPSQTDGLTGAWIWEPGRRYRPDGFG